MRESLDRAFVGQALGVEVFGAERVTEGLVTDWIWWTWSGSNRRPLPCHGSALPAAPQAHDWRDNSSIVVASGWQVKPGALRIGTRSSEHFMRRIDQSLN